jgi:hypothetical protein
MTTEDSAIHSLEILHLASILYSDVRNLSKELQSLKYVGGT